MTVDLIELEGQQIGIGQPFAARLYRPSRFEVLQNGGGVSGSNYIGGDVSDDDGTGPDDAVFSDRHALADDRAIPDPDILTDADGNRLSDREPAVIHPV